VDRIKRALLKATRPPTVEYAVAQERNEEEVERDYQAVTTMDWANLGNWRYF
jgi:hypothetical protein